MDNWALLLTLYSIVLPIVSCGLTYLLCRKESFFVRKSVTLVLLVDNSRKHIRKSDATFQFDDTLENVQQCVLNFPGLNREIIERLLAEHPGVTHLTLSVSGLTVLMASASLHKIGDLLDGWKSSLLSLKLILNFTHFPGNASDTYGAPPGAVALLGVINQRLTCLEHLTLVSNRLFLPNDAFRLSVLRRLRSFTIDSQDPVYLLIPSFSIYATRNEALAAIQMANRMACDSTYPALTDALWSKFTHLHVDFNQEESPAGQPFIALFPRLLGLKFLCLTLERLDTSQYWRLMATLAVLEQLTSLELQCEHLEATLRGDETSLQPVRPVLAIIRRLSLVICSLGHEINQVARFSVDTIFPRLDILKVHFIAIGCGRESCLYGPEFRDDESDEGWAVPSQVMQHCAAQLYQQVAQVPVARKEVTFEWPVQVFLVSEKIWTPPQLAIQE